MWQFNAMGRINATPAEITGETRLDDQYGMKMQAMAALHWQYPEGNTPKRGFDEPLPRCRTLARLFATTTVRCILLNVMCVQVKAKTEWFPGRGIRGIPSQSWVKCDLELQLGPELVDERILLGDGHLRVVVVLSILDAPAGHPIIPSSHHPIIREANSLAWLASRRKSAALAASWMADWETKRYSSGL